MQSPSLGAMPPFGPVLLWRIFLPFISHEKEIQRGQTCLAWISALSQSLWNYCGSLLLSLNHKLFFWPFVVDWGLIWSSLFTLDAQYLHVPRWIKFTLKRVEKVNINLVLIHTHDISTKYSTALTHNKRKWKTRGQERGVQRVLLLREWLCVLICVYVCVLLTASFAAESARVPRTVNGGKVSCEPSGGQDSWAGDQAGVWEDTDQTVGGEIILCVL